MKYILPLLVLALFITSCGDSDDDRTYTDTLVGEYSGIFKTLSCNLPQEELESVNSTAEIVKNSETSIDFIISDTSGELYSFTAVVNADSTITIPEYTSGEEMLKGSASKNPKLRILLGSDCVIFATEAPTYTFDEN